MKYRLVIFSILILGVILMLAWIFGDLVGSPPRSEIVAKALGIIGAIGACLFVAAAESIWHHHRNEKERE